jgi:hypothetical protein
MTVALAVSLARRFGLRRFSAADPAYAAHDGEPARVAPPPSGGSLACVDCGAPLAYCLAELGALRCHDCYLP